jgi:hypothetical protein
VTPDRRLRVAGAAGLAYVVLAGVENMEVLRAPAPDAAAAGIRAAYADQALAAATALAGVASLASYAVFAVALASRAPRRAPAIAAGLAGPLLALAGIVATAPLVLGAAGSDRAVRGAYALQHDLRLLAGPCLALVVVSIAAGGILPAALRRAAAPLAVALAVAPLALAGPGTGAATAAFGLHSLWLGAVSLWLLGGPTLTPRERLRHGAFLALVVAAGGVGLALLALPHAAGAFFAWELAPAPLAAFAGGAYVGAAVVHAAALRAPALPARSLEAAAAVLSVSVLAITLTHLEPFDLGRAQAWAWLVLFAGFSVITTTLALTGRRTERDDRGRLPRTGRAGFGTVAGVLLAAAAVLWAAHPGLPPLGGRFAGSWAAMLAAAAAWPAVTGRRDDALLPALALVAVPAGTLSAGLRTGHHPALLGASAALAAAGVLLLRLAQDPGGEDRGVLRAVHAHAGHGHTRRHLRDRQQRVEPAGDRLG